MNDAAHRTQIQPTSNPIYTKYEYRPNENLNEKEKNNKTNYAKTHYVNLKRFCKMGNKTEDPARAEESKSRFHFVMDSYECPCNMLVRAYDPCVCIL